jgi:hypothetical protein
MPPISAAIFKTFNYNLRVFVRKPKFPAKKTNSLFHLIT